MKYLLLALICITTLMSCGTQIASRDINSPNCVDPETGIAMSQEACDALERERARNRDVEDRLGDDTEDNTDNNITDGKTPTPKPTPNNPTDKPSETPIPTPVPTPELPTPTPTSDNFIGDDGFFTHQELGMRFPIREGYRVERLEIPEEPTRYVDKYEAIGYFRVDASDGEDFLIIVERFAEGLDEDGFPKAVPAEGGISNRWIELPGGIKGYEYSSNALGFYEDAHITIFREDKIYYLREVNNEESLSNRLRAFAREFEIID